MEVDREEIIFVGDSISLNQWVPLNYGGRKGRRYYCVGGQPAIICVYSILAFNRFGSYNRFESNWIIEQKIHINSKIQVDRVMLDWIKIQ